MRRSFVSGLAPSSNLIVATFLGASLLGLAGCSRRSAVESPPPQEKKAAAPHDLCALLTHEELERILGARPQKSQSSEIPGGGFMISQCQYEMAAAADSISVSVTRSLAGPQGRDPKDFIEQRIADYEKREGEREKGEEDKGLDFVTGLGDKALWMGTMVGGNLYVLKGHLLIRIAVGSTKDPATRKDKTIELARLLVDRL